MELMQVLDQYHIAADRFSRGDPTFIKSIFSHRDDVILANPFGPAVRGWKKVSEALDYASSRMREGYVKEFETIGEYETPEFATIVEREHWNAKVSGRDELSTFDLRVTNIFRCEDGEWKLVHRHADPISTFDPDGPLRKMSS